MLLTNSIPQDVSLDIEDQPQLSTMSTIDVLLEPGHHKFTRKGLPSGYTNSTVPTQKAKPKAAK